ncbi:MAG: cysteine desulfurase [Candidatus Magasanikbacteria bacterium CG11_big_fil_rev_8_21_14_0_20_39_34]|uniref:Cysteine desulfurase n=1 Tax=Candidatus Magasanikbacteria bacterium CG11_big_fil_rev_8_21_14_0_20_39_34 TaxID=1974653 RepID=A0A2H0N5E2_9BACT|nr:MAG: cysteine desulfurase [Candidatus Magasanikbacteria bacterium CG11_big_fil_rev_8_21_14_0_20_39_34]
MNSIREQFPLLRTYKDLVYLDNAATTQKPESVIKAVTRFYEKQNANVHRGAYKLSDISSQLYVEAHTRVASFLNAYPDEIIFNSGATAGLNTLAYGLTKNLEKGDNVVLTRMEHHSNLLPWIEMSKRRGFEVRFIGLNPESGELLEEDIDTCIDERTRVVTFVHTSNVLGIVNPMHRLITRAKAMGALTVVDACQAVAHQKIDVKALDCDFLVFSGHKLYGPTGIGVLYGKKERLEKMDPFHYGGGMVARVSDLSIAWKDAPMKFEAGTPHIAGAIGLSAALKYLENLGWEEIFSHTETLTKYATETLSKIKDVKIFGKNAERRGMIAFEVEGVHSHDVAQIFDSENIAVRAGQHCATLFVQELTDNGIVRASMGIYNTKKDIDKLIVGIEKVKKMFHV